VRVLHTQTHTRTGDVERECHMCECRQVNAASLETIVGVQVSANVNVNECGRESVIHANTSESR
jgi:hypothetical protein